MAAPSDTSSSRRDALGAASVAVASGAAALAAWPVGRYLAAPGLPTARAPSRVEVCADAQLAPGQMRLARAADATIAVLRRHDGTLVAFVASCTHLGCTVRFRADKDDLHCGCHGATFDPATGAPRSGPAVSPLGSIPVEVRDGRIFVGT